MHKKTGKREYAFVFVVLLCYLVYQESKDILQVVIWPFITFIAAAAGMHIYDKNTAVDINARDRFLRSSDHDSTKGSGR